MSKLLADNPTFQLFFYSKNWNEQNKKTARFLNLWRRLMLPLFQRNNYINFETGKFHTENNANLSFQFVSQGKKYVSILKQNTGNLIFFLAVYKSVCCEQLP